MLIAPCLALVLPVAPSEKATWGASGVSFWWWMKVRSSRDEREKVSTFLKRQFYKIWGIARECSRHWAIIQNILMFINTESMSWVMFAYRTKKDSRLQRPRLLCVVGKKDYGQKGWVQQENNYVCLKDLHWTSVPSVFLTQKKIA